MYDQNQFLFLKLLKNVCYLRAFGLLAFPLGAALAVLPLTPLTFASFVILSKLTFTYLNYLLQNFDYLKIIILLFINVSAKYFFVNAVLYTGRLTFFNIHFQIKLLLLYILYQ